LNPLGQNRLHRLKPYLFHTLVRLGVPVPRFIVSSSGRDLLEFLEDNSRKHLRIVEKPMAGIFKTMLQTEETWRLELWKIRGAFYQRYVEGDTIRCYVLNDRVIAAAKILFQGTTDSSLSQTGITIIDLPSRAARVARAATRALDVRFCGIDLMRDSRSGDYYVIDCNFSPMFVNFSRLSGIDISAHLADYLIRSVPYDSYRPSRGVALLREAKGLLIRDRKIRRKLGLQ
jgi:glutathione synthase/RimK-type ligase-like ATP-grasp enzyme